MPDPTPERVGELLEEWRADKAAGGYEANSYDLAQHLADEYGPLAESWQRQRAELALVEQDERPKGVKRVVYPDIDPCELDERGGYYVRHIEAMTVEGLHSKFEIAEQLGARDAEIDRQRAEIEALTALVRECAVAMQNALDQDGREWRSLHGPGSDYIVTLECARLAATDDSVPNKEASKGEQYDQQA